MFCSKCGTALNDADMFCRSCGNAVAPEKTQTSSLPNGGSNDVSEVNREVAVCHLHDLLALECACSVIEEEISAVKANADSLTIVEWDTAEYLPPKYPYKNILNMLFEIKWYLLITLAVGIFGFFVPGTAGKVYSTVGFSLFFVRLIYRVAEETFYYLKDRIEYNNKYKAYNKSVIECNVVVRSNQTIHDGLALEQKTLDERLAPFKQALTRAYSANLIPKQFRNIYAVYYLYDYMSTSQESLSSAFLQCNLEEIKQRLETIIMQNREMIIQQALIISQNEIMIDEMREQNKRLDNIQEQNQQMLQYAAETEKNTKKAAQYAQVAASNAEACALFHYADYLRK